MRAGSRSSTASRPRPATSPWQPSPGRMSCSSSSARTARTATRSPPTLEAFQARHGIQIVPISVDGGGLPNFPQYRRDNGISRTLQVTQVPAVFLAEPFTGKITPIGFGVLSSRS